MLCESITSRKAFICRSLWHLGVSDLCQLIYQFHHSDLLCIYSSLRKIVYHIDSWGVLPLNVFLIVSDFFFTGDYPLPPPPVTDTSGLQSPSSFPPPPPMDEASFGFQVRFAKPVKSLSIYNMTSSGVQKFILLKKIIWLFFFLFKWLITF